MPRTSCIWIPHFELRARVTLTAPELAGQPLIVADASSLRAIVLDASLEACAQGIQRRMPMTTARALCPEVIVIPPDPAFVRQLSQRILEALYRFSPIVGSDGIEAFFLTLDGLDRIHADEMELASALHPAIAEMEHVGVIAIADSPISAWIVTRATTGEKTIIVPPGEDRAFLATLPIQALPLPDQIARLCRILGLSQIADLQRLPQGALIQRFGRSGAELEQRIHSRAGDLFRVEMPKIIEEVELQLDYPVDDKEVLLFLHKSALDRLLKQVAHTRHAIAAFDLRLTLCDQARSLVEQRFRPASPTLASRTLLELIVLWLSNTSFTDAVDTIVLRATEVAVATQKQLRLFDRQADLREDAIAQAIARLSAAFGQSAIVFPRLADSHLPEARLRWAPIEASRPSRASPAGLRSRTSPSRHTRSSMPCSPITPSSPPGRRAADDPAALPPPPLLPTLNLLTPPWPIILRPPDLAQARWLRLERDVFFVAGEARGSESYEQQILERDGPYALTGPWWDSAPSRHYMLVICSNGGAYWIYREDDRFYLHAILD
jgi:hypothetical protein